MMTRRRMFRLSAAAAAGALSGCLLPQDDSFMAHDIERQHDDARLRSRARGTRASTVAGTHRIDAGSGRDALLYVPAAEQAAFPLAIMLHGAGGDVERAAAVLTPFAERHGVAVLAPASLGETWDAIRGGFGADVVRIDDALETVFDRWPIDPGRIAIGGFSDGASYALGLGLANGDLFSSIFAFSPGFIPPMEAHGRPRVFVTHGTRDNVLPVTRCGRVVVAQLKRRRYPLVYREFDGPHTIPKSLAEEALRWFVQSA